MSNQPSQSFCGKISAALLLAASLSLGGLSGLTGAVLAQASSESGSAAASQSAGMSSSSAAVAGSSSAAGQSAGGSSATTNSGDASAATTAAGTSAGAGTETGLWTSPKYAVKEMPQTQPTPKTKTKTTTTVTTAAVNPMVYDDKAAKDFADSVTMPQYVWTRLDKKTKGQKNDAINTTKEMAAYNRALVEKFVANMTVPNSATLVENSQTKYLYLLSFVIDAKGKISHINSEKSYGSFNAVNLADDGENSTMSNSITRALAKCSPLAVPPAGVPPWYMLLRYEPDSGKVFVANLNTI